MTEGIDGGVRVEKRKPNTPQLKQAIINMNFLKKIFSSKSQKGWQDETSEAVFIYSQCDKCGEKFRNRIDKTYDLMSSYEDKGPAYRTRKELIGSRCRNRVILNLEFDAQKHLSVKSAENGTLIDREEFEGKPEESSEEV